MLEQSAAGRATRMYLTALPLSCLGDGFISTFFMDCGFSSSASYEARMLYYSTVTVTIYLFILLMILDVSSS